MVGVREYIGGRGVANIMSRVKGGGGSGGGTN